MNIKYLILTFTLMMATSCYTEKLYISSISYQSIKEKSPSSKAMPDTANIMAVYTISPKGELQVYIKNLSQHIMTIDRTKSFIINSDGTSLAFYDPNIITTTSAQFSSTTTSSSTTFTPGPVANVLGIGGIAGGILNGIGSTNSESRMAGEIIANSVAVIDQPKISIPPKGQVNMARTVQLNGVGTFFLEELANYNDPQRDIILNLGPNDVSSSTFSVVISYSIDNENTYLILNSEFYTDILMQLHVKENGKTNNVLRTILSHPTFFMSSWNVIYFDTGDCKESYNSYVQDYVLYKYN